MINIKFMRYTGHKNDKVEWNHDVPAHILGMYPKYDRTPMTKRNRIWSGKNVRGNFGTNILQALLTDDDYLRSYVPEWVLRGIRNYTSNLYVYLNVSEDTNNYVVEAAPKEEEPVADAPKVKRRRQPREKKVDPVKEARKVFKSAKNRLNNKIRLLKTLNHWEDPMPLSNRGDAAEQERTANVLKNVFNAYKVYFEEELTAKSIPFFIRKEEFNPSNMYRRGGTGIYTEYVLVNNSENVPVEIMQKQSYNVITLAWLSNNRLRNKNTYYRDYERVLSISKIGISAKNHDYLHKSDVKPFKTMREQTFNELVTKVLTSNNERYAAKIDDFKSLQARVAQNQVEEAKLKEFLTKKVISVVDASYLRNSNLDFTKGHFEVSVPVLPSSNWGRDEVDILEVRKHTDDTENQTFQINFFSRKSVGVKNAADAIAAIENVFNNGINTVIDAISRMNLI